MLEVSFDRICDIGGAPGFCITTWQRQELLSIGVSGDVSEGSTVFLNKEQIISQIESLGATKELHINGVRDIGILSAARLWYRAQSYYSESLHTFVIPPASRLTLGIYLEDLVYDASLGIDSGGVRSLIAALNDGIIMRILPSSTPAFHIDKYLAQSHASIRLLAKGLDEGWIPTFERSQLALPLKRVYLQILPPAWSLAHYE